jgi:hypothetical protein
MRRGMIAALTAAALMVLPVSNVSAQPDREDFSADLGVTGVVQDPDPRVTPNDKWVFFEGKTVTAAGAATIGTIEYTALLDATLWGKLSPEATEGIEWGTFTLTLDDGDLVCDGTFKVKRYAVADGLWTRYGESGNFRADCDGAKVMGEFVGEPPADGSPGFLLTMDGTAR